MRCIFALLLSFAINCMAAVPDANSLWKLYKLATSNEESCDNMLYTLERFNETNSPLYTGYKASATILKAKYAFSPVNKLSYFSKGTKLLEKCLLADKSNLELRFLRLSVQLKSPSFLGYNENIKEDKEFIINNIQNHSNMEWKQFATSFLLDSGSLTTQEKTKLNDGTNAHSGR
jgi:hypothetical protein